MNLTILEDFEVPILDEALQRTVAQTVTDAYEQEEASRRVYAEAAKLLESALGLQALDLKPRFSYERTSTEAESKDRLDAEYFQPSKGAVLDALAEMPGASVSEQLRSVRELWQPNKARMPGGSPELRPDERSSALPRRNGRTSAMRHDRQRKEEAKAWRPGGFAPAFVLEGNRCGLRYRRSSDGWF